MTLSAIEALQSLRAVLVNNPTTCVDLSAPLTINIVHQPRALEIKLVDLALAELQGKDEGRAVGGAATQREQCAGLPEKALEVVPNGVGGS